MTTNKSDRGNLNSTRLDLDCVGLLVMLSQFHAKPNKHVQSCGTMEIKIVTKCLILDLIYMGAIVVLYSNHAVSCGLNLQTSINDH